MAARAGSGDNSIHGLLCSVLISSRCRDAVPPLLISVFAAGETRSSKAVGLVWLLEARFCCCFYPKLACEPRVVMNGGCFELANQGVNGMASAPPSLFPLSHYLQAHSHTQIRTRKSPAPPTNPPPLALPSHSSFLNFATI